MSRVRNRDAEPSFFNEDVKAVLIILAVLAVIICGVAVNYTVTKVDDADMTAQVMAQTDSTSVEVVGHTNRLFVLGNPSEVTFRVILDDGREVSVACQNGWWQQTVCKVYAAGG